MREKYPADHYYCYACGKGVTLGSLSRFPSHLSLFPVFSLRAGEKEMLGQVFFVSYLSPFLYSCVSFIAATPRTDSNGQIHQSFFSKGSPLSPSGNLPSLPFTLNYPTLSFFFLLPWQPCICFKCDMCRAKYPRGVRCVTLRRAKNKSQPEQLLPLFSYVHTISYRIQNETNFTVDLQFVFPKCYQATKGKNGGFWDIIMYLQAPHQKGIRLTPQFGLNFISK